MKFRIRKRFKTIIITKRMILTVICLFILILSSIFSLIYNTDNVNTLNQYTSNDEFHNLIISEALLTKDSEKEKLAKLINGILGFDISKPQTILYSASSQFCEIKEYSNQNETVLPEKADKNEEKAAEPVEEKPIEEVNISKGVTISNGTNIDVNVKDFLNTPLSYSLTNDGPQVLIVHTHTTESYTDSEKTKYTATDSDRSTDEAKNMTAVGNALSEVLNANGIQTIHDATVHDYPAYNGSYNRSKATVLANLKKYPSIKLVLDIHRDGIVREDGTKVKVACDINGSKASQCMFVVGTDVLLTHNNWRENMKLACQLQATADKLYPGFMRPINLREQRFNQQLSDGALIIEVGSNGNTLNESIYAAKLIGNVIVNLFKS